MTVLLPFFPNKNNKNNNYYLNKNLIFNKVKKFKKFRIRSPPSPPNFFFLRDKISLKEKKRPLGGQVCD
jgi:hypothetical protein